MAEYRRILPERDIDPDEGPSRGALKRDSEALQDLGVALADLREETFVALDLPLRLRAAVVELKRLTVKGAIRRQRQYIGKLMRTLEPALVNAIRVALQAQHQQSRGERLALHQVEGWRDRLLAEDDALSAWVLAHPGADVQQLRALIRQARKEASALPAVADGAPRHGRAYRQLFQFLKAAVAGEV
jgi:ribosome-associated protein